MKRKSVLFFLLFISLNLFSQIAEKAPRGSVLLLTISGPIDPITARYQQRGIARGTEDGAQLVVLSLDTPGGLSVSMDQMVQAILSSKVPVAVFVSPRGARDASTGVFVTMAAHIAAMAPGTHIGAAHPVASGGAVEKPGGDAGAKRDLSRGRRAAELFPDGERGRQTESRRS
jgi:membrane-bound serine protease (ClpP class)